MEAALPRRRRGRSRDRRQGLGECAAIFHGLDFRQAVEPGEEVLGQLAILEALVELLTDCEREPAILQLRIIGDLASVTLLSCGTMITGMRQD